MKDEAEHDDRTADVTPDSEVDSDRAAAVDESAADSDVSAGPATASGKRKRTVRWSAVVPVVVLPLLAILLTGAAGFLKWQDSTARASEAAGVEAVQAAKDATIALLSYKPDTVDQDLGAATQRLTGSFQEDYEDLINRVVIPGSKEQRISTTASVPSAAVVSATPQSAVLLLFVNQTTTIGSEPPSDMQSSVRVTMDKVDGRWLMSRFDPV